MIPIITLGTSQGNVSGLVARILTFVVITLVVFCTWIYVGRKSRSRPLPWTNKYGPLILVLVGGFLMLLEPMRVELSDTGLIDIPVYDV